MRRSVGWLLALAFVAASGAIARAIVVVNFDTYPGGAAVQIGETLTTQWSSMGVEFSDGAGGGPGPSGPACSYSPPNHAASGGLIVAIFVDPCTGVPSVTDLAGTRQDFCWVPGEGIDMYWYDAGGGLLHQEFNAGGGNLTTFGTAQPAIARLHMFHIGQGIDDFQFNTPAPVLRGDMECDGDVDDFDVEPFVLALIDAPTYIAAYPTCDIRRADMNCDRKVDGLDVQGFTDAAVP